MAELRQRDDTAALALQFLILTATRTGEVRGARWTEINLADRVWTIPAERMKAKKEHRVPLSDAALAILEAARASRVDDYVFPGRGAMLGPNTLMRVLQALDRGELSVHGFRSTFRDWAAETTAYAREVAEMALAHTISNQVEAAYRRGDLFQKRRRLMQDWSKYCAAPEASGEVVPISVAR